MITNLLSFEYNKRINLLNKYFDYKFLLNFICINVSDLIKINTYNSLFTLIHNYCIIRYLKFYVKIKSINISNYA